MKPQLDRGRATTTTTTTAGLSGSSAKQFESFFDTKQSTSVVLMSSQVDMIGIRDASMNGAKRSGGDDCWANGSILN
jgi:hypothetical protein